MRILLLGKNGQLGWELHRSLLPLGEVQALDYPEIDLAKPESLREIIRASTPDVIINATAYTAVDKAESERDLAFAINAASPKVMAEEAKKMGAALIHYSTDYVFDGKKGEPYVETDTPNPLNVYGASKLAGERAGCRAQVADPHALEAGRALRFQEGPHLDIVTETTEGARHLAGVDLEPAARFECQHREERPLRSALPSTSLR